MLEKILNFKALQNLNGSDIVYFIKVGKCKLISCFTFYYA